ncbi:MAG: glycoside hydrolase family 2 TIM barrel-domain containing protein [Chloroflexi bacterium OHK40]
MDLTGTWAFRLDPDDRGLANAWQAQAFTEMIELPGSLQAQGFGNDVTVETPWVGLIMDRSWFTEARFAPYREPSAVKVPFWLQPEKHYSGVAWYQRTFQAPDSWFGQRVLLTLERAHWATTVWLDGQELGSDSSLSTPHQYLLGTAVMPGPHRLTIRVDNRMIIPVGANAHSVTDHTQTNWNGIIGRIALSTSAPVWIDDLQVYPRAAERRVSVRLRIGNGLGRGGRARLTLQAVQSSGDGVHAPPAATFELPIDVDGATAELSYALGPDARLWDEFSPALYRLHGALSATVDDQSFTDEASTVFGLRDITVHGTQIAVNGRPIMLRGTLECCIFPLTGYPPTAVAPWRRMMNICRAHGLNHIRFHSWCPPEAAFVAADELGFYLQVEGPVWANHGATIGDGSPLDSWLHAETARILRCYGNHPSFVLMAHGNEPAGERHVPFLGDWVRHWKARDPRRLFTAGAGWPRVDVNDYHNIPEPRVQGWGEELRSRINGRPPETCSDYSAFVRDLARPIVSHEIGQWCVFPNFDEIGKYTGLLKPKNFELFRDLLTANHMGDQARAFLLASGKLQALCYKEEIEAALRTPGFAGFQLLDLHDFPGQGTALVGVLDPFWDEKGYITAQAFRRFCGDTVPLARLPKRTWHTGERLTAEVDVAHFGPTDLIDTTATWRLLDHDGRTVAGGQFPTRHVPTGGLTHLGTLDVALGTLPPAAKYTLAVSLDDARAENDWDLWLFAERLAEPEPAGALVATALDKATLAELAKGGAVLLALPPEQVRASAQIGFSSIFWNTAWTKRDGADCGQAPHTLGILCDPAHPALAAFPTEFHSNWQWWELIHGAAAMTIDHLPPALRPIVQPIDTWFENRRLGLLFEARVYGGRLLVCSMDLTSDLERRLVARQLRASLLSYLTSERFEPHVELTVDAIRALCLP